MNKPEKPKGVTVLLDAAIAMKLFEIRQDCIQKLKASGLPASYAPSIGFIARDILQKAMQLNPETANAYNRQIDGMTS